MSNNKGVVVQGRFRNATADRLQHSVARESDRSSMIGASGTQWTTGMVVEKVLVLEQLARVMPEPIATTLWDVIDLLLNVLEAQPQNASAGPAGSAAEVAVSR